MGAMSTASEQRRDENAAHLLQNVGDLCLGRIVAGVAVHRGHACHGTQKELEVSEMITE